MKYPERCYGNAYFQHVNIFKIKHVALNCQTFFLKELFKQQQWWHDGLFFNHVPSGKNQELAMEHHLA